MARTAGSGGSAGASREASSGEVPPGEALSGETLSGEVLFGAVLSGAVLSGEVLSSLLDAREEASDGSSGVVPESSGEALPRGCEERVQEEGE